MKKKNNWFKRFLIISFIIFMGLYISSISGFYESTLNNKVALTDKAIKEFEEDVLNGKNVDVTTYVNNKHVDYQVIDAEENEALCDEFEIMQAPTLVVVHEEDKTYDKFANASNIIKYLNDNIA